MWLNEWWYRQVRAELVWGTPSFWVGSSESGPEVPHPHGHTSHVADSTWARNSHILFCNGSTHSCFTATPYPALIHTERVPLAQGWHSGRGQQLLKLEAGGAEQRQRGG